MAILDGIKVTVEVEGTDKQEYNHPRAPFPPKRMAKYFEAVGNSRFLIRIVADTDFVYHGNALAFQITIDDTLVVERVCDRAAASHVPGRPHNCVFRGIHDRGTFNAWRFNPEMSGINDDSCKIMIRIWHANIVGVDPTHLDLFPEDLETLGVSRTVVADPGLPMTESRTMRVKRLGRKKDEYVFRFDGWTRETLRAKGIVASDQ